MEMSRHRDANVIGRVRAYLARRDWHTAKRRELNLALRDLDVLERRVGQASVHSAPVLSASINELRRTLVKLGGSRGGGWHRAASLF